MDWSVKGDYAENCNCDIVCPCLYLQPASMGPCHAMLIWDIKEGHCDDVKLDGDAFLSGADDSDAAYRRLLDAGRACQPTRKYRIAV